MCELRGVWIPSSRCTINNIIAGVNFFTTMWMIDWYSRLSCESVVASVPSLFTELDASLLFQITHTVCVYDHNVISLMRVKRLQRNATNNFRSGCIRKEAMSNSDNHRQLFMCRSLDLQILGGTQGLINSRYMCIDTLQMLCSLHMSHMLASLQQFSSRGKQCVTYIAAV